MRYTLFLILFLITLVISSCIDTRPFEVGSNIDAEYDIVNMNNLEPTLKSVAKAICTDNLTGKMAIGYFIDRLNYNSVNAEGRYIAKDLAERLASRCRMNVELVDSLPYVTFEKKQTVIKPIKGFDHFLLGTYRYENKGYNMFIRIVNPKSGKTIEEFAKRICNREIEFDIEPLHIPERVIIPLPWRK